MVVQIFALDVCYSRRLQFKQNLMDCLENFIGSRNEVCNRNSDIEENIPSKQVTKKSCPE
jgi:hypothetical protein